MPLSWQVKDIASLSILLDRLPHAHVRCGSFGWSVANSHLQLESNEHVSDAWLALLLRAAPRLRRLSMRFHEGVTAAGLQHLAALTALSRIDLCAHSVAHVVSFAALRVVLSLRELRVSDALSDASLAALAAHLPHVTLHFTSCFEEGLNHVVWDGARLNIRRDAVSGWGRGDVTAAGLAAAAAALPGLQTLILGKGYAHADALEALAARRPAALQRVELVGLPDGEDGGAALAALGALPALQEVVVWPGLRTAQEPEAVARHLGHVRLYRKCKGDWGEGCPDQFIWDGEVLRAPAASLTPAKMDCLACMKRQHMYGGRWDCGGHSDEQQDETSPTAAAVALGRLLAAVQGPLESARLDFAIEDQQLPAMLQALHAAAAGGSSSFAAAAATHCSATAAVWHGDCLHLDVYPFNFISSLRRKWAATLKNCGGYLSSCAQVGCCSLFGRPFSMAPWSGCMPGGRYHAF